MSRPLLALLSLSLGGLAGCPAEPYAAAGGQPKAQGGAARAEATPAAAAPADDRRPHFVAAGDGPLVETIQAAHEDAERDDRQLVVYVGASWCEPCTAFHDAVQRGELDEALAGVRFLELDSDRVGEQLPGAGYGGRYIPRFVVPGPDGRGTERAIEGGIKGPGAVDHIMQRLGPLLRRAGS